MTREDLIRGAGASAPELMQKTAEILSVIEHHNPENAKLVVEEINAIAEYTSEKLAFGPLAMWGAAAAGSAASGVLNSMAGDLYDAAKRGLTRERNLKAIMQANPELKAFDKTRLQACYSAIHRYSPELTADPLIGGSLLKNMAEVPGNESQVIKDLLTSRKNLLDSKDKQYRPGNPIELPSNLEERRDRRDTASARWDRKMDRTNVLQKKRDYSQKLKSDKENMSEKKRQFSENLKTNTHVRPLVDLRVNQAMTNIGIIKSDKGLSSDEKRLQIRSIVENAKTDLGKIRAGKIV
jgi:hypothetical protein